MNGEHLKAEASVPVDVPILPEQALGGQASVSNLFWALSGRKRNAASGGGRLSTPAEL
jgi:hypothetical protein